VERVAILLAALFITCGALIYFIEDISGSRLPLYTDRVETWIQILVIVVLLSVLSISIVKNALAVCNTNRLKKLQIVEADERNILIKQKTGSIGVSIIMFGLAIMTIVLGSGSPSTFWGLFFALVFVVLVHIFLVVYYRRKF